MTDHDEQGRADVGTGPFEDLGDEQVTTFSCPHCDAHHNREQYQEVRKERRADMIVTIYQCPNGHEVELDMTAILPDDPADPVYVELDPKETDK